MIRTIVLCSLFLTVPCADAADAADAADWPQFRGPNCTGISTSTKPLPVRFSATEGVKWSARPGEGIGSPVVAAGRVFTSAMIDESHVGLFAYDALTGRPLWKRSWLAGDLADIHKTNSHASIGHIEIC